MLFRNHGSLSAKQAYEIVCDVIRLAELFPKDPFQLFQYDLGSHQLVRLQDDFKQTRTKATTGQCAGQYIGIKEYLHETS